MLKKSLLTAVALLGLTLPSQASLQIIMTDGATTVSCTDGSGCDFAGTTNNLITLNTTVGNFHVNGTMSTSTSGAHNTLDLSTFEIRNISGGTDTLSILVGQTDFQGPVTSITESGSITFHGNAGIGPSTLAFYAANGNTQPTLAAPGTLLFTASSTPTLVVDSFTGTNISAFADPNLFSMAMLANITLQSNAYVDGFAMGMDSQTSAVPEPSTWAMMLLGFAGIGSMALRRKRALGLA